MTFPLKPKGVLIDFKAIDEAWSLYRLEDGNYIRVKTIMVKCTKADQPNPDGSPGYFIQGQNVVVLLTADEVQKLYKHKLETEK
jgi:hypothetical protein